MSSPFPFAPQDPAEVSYLIQALQRATKKERTPGSKPAGRISCKKTTFEVNEASGCSVDSWRFQDWDYKRDDLPTYSRGLFTTQRRGGTPEIAIRGYDKFFNVEEVNETRWSSVEANTQGPYELSVKENGCILFISGLEDDVLLVCSKHSTGPGAQANLSHASVGGRWIDKQLAAIGKTRQDLARELRARNVTAVAELCDDAFEEHVLAYDEQAAGLYLHGMNLNLPQFVTYPGSLVHEFADRWGFKKAEYLVKDDFASTKRFLEQCAETGSWNGRETEGFVIRCRRRSEQGRPPVDWFFKYKFEEPYLMYRQWREATKAMIAGKTPRYKKHQKITEQYLLFARRQLAQHPGLGKAYNANHGIIAMRDAFLRELGLRGSDIIRQEDADDTTKATETAGPMVLVPIATIGCGKTTLAVALTKLFNWGHVQNDNITGKQNRPKQFASLVANQLAIDPVVLADRNNHQKRERKQLIEDLSALIPNVRFVALHYVHDPQRRAANRRVTQDRVLARGDNHQTIQAGSKSKTEILGIMQGFINRFEPLDVEVDPDNAFDEVIELEVTEPTRANLEKVVSALHSAYPAVVPEEPTADELDDAIAAALHDYQPDIKHDLSIQSKGKDRERGPRNRQNGNRLAEPKAAKVEYFGVFLPTNEILARLDTAFGSLRATKAAFYRQLQQMRRVQSSFHVTLIHRASVADHTDVWERLNSLYLRERPVQHDTSDPLLGYCRIILDRVIWDDRLMCITARIVDQSWESVNSVAHVTIGTANPGIKPKESIALLSRWIREGASEESGIAEFVLKDEEEIEGEVRAILPLGR